jgi:hypothetical protein
VSRAFRAHRGKANHAFYAHRPRPHGRAFGVHLLRWRKVARPKKPAKPKKPKVVRYKSALPAVPAAYKPGKPKPYRPVKPAKPNVAALKASRVAAMRNGGSG